MPGDVARIGLAHGQAVAADDRAEKAHQVELLQQHYGKPVGLVGADRHGVTCRVKRFQRGDDTGERPAGIGDMVAVIGQEQPVSCRHRLVVCRRARDGEAAPDQGQRAVPDHLAHLGQADRGPAESLEHMIGGCCQVGRGIDEGAVEIEQQRGGAVKHRVTQVYF